VPNEEAGYNSQLAGSGSDLLDIIGETKPVNENHAWEEIVFFKGSIQ